MKTKLFFKLLFIILIMNSCTTKSPEQITSTTPDWKSKFDEELPYLGHRNWILVVDKAFPMQSSAGMEVINTNENLIPVLEYIMAQIKATSHVRPIIYTDQELNYVHDNLSTGADAFRTQLHNTLVGTEINTLLHETVFSKLNESSKLFKVVVLKTECTIPYSSVFMHLDCAYWSNEKEQTLRRAMAHDLNDKPAVNP